MKTTSKIKTTSKMKMTPNALHIRWSWDEGPAHWRSIHGARHILKCDIFFWMVCIFVSISFHFVPVNFYYSILLFSACCTGTSLPFLDTSCNISEGKIKVDLYRKPTDRNQYLLPSSCHPAHVTSNIPFSLAYRIVRICSDPETRDKRLDELKQLLVDRNYKKVSLTRQF